MFFFLLDIDIETGKSHVIIFINSAIINQNDDENDGPENLAPEYLDEEIRNVMVEKDNCLIFTSTGEICSTGT